MPYQTTLLCEIAYAQIVNGISEMRKLKQKQQLLHENIATYKYTILMYKRQLNGNLS